MGKKEKEKKVAHDTAAKTPVGTEKDRPDGVLSDEDLAKVSGGAYEFYVRIEGTKQGLTR